MRGERRLRGRRVKVPVMRGSVFLPGAYRFSSGIARILQLVEQGSGGPVGLPEDCAHLVSFLCSAEGGWINGQLLYSNGGV